MKRKIEVVISDGNTIVNEIHAEEETIADVLKQHGFNWMHGTLCINGVSIPEEYEKQIISAPVGNFNVPTIPLEVYYTMSNRIRYLRVKIDCQTPANDPSKLTAKQIAQLREKQKAVERKDSPSPVKGTDTRFPINTHTYVYSLKDGVAIP